MSAGLKGKKGLSKEERQSLFCTTSRLCSGKASTEQEAAKLCAEAASNPKPLTATKGTRSRKCKVDTNTLAACIIKGMAGNEITLVNLTPVLAGCTGQKVTKLLSQKEFMKKCFKKNPVRDMREANKIRLLCISQWKEGDGKES